MVRASRQRRHLRRRDHELWFTFDPQDGGQVAGGFGPLEALNEDRLQPGGKLPPQPFHETEIITYVREGALAHEDSVGHSGVVQSGEFLRRSARRGVRHRETNASHAESVHLFQIWLHPQGPPAELGQEQRRFCAADRRGLLCLVGSPDGRRGSLHIRQDVLIYSAMLDPGQHLAHDLGGGRRAWLHVVQGEASLGDQILTTGDGASISAEHVVSLTARTATEILLVDLAQEPKP